MPSAPSEIFVSFAEKDRKRVLAIVDRLADEGHRLWCAPRAIRGAQQWHDEIGKALARCDWFLLMLSKHSVRSKWVKRELLYALNESHYEERISPVYLGSCDPKELSWVLPSIQAVTLQGSVPDLSELLGVLRV